MTLLAVVCAMLAEHLRRRGGTIPRQRVVDVYQRLASALSV
jgi:hypothetical protein